MFVEGKKSRVRFGGLARLISKEIESECLLALTIIIPTHGPFRIDPLGFSRLLAVSREFGELRIEADLAYQGLILGILRV